MIAPRRSRMATIALAVAALLLAIVVATGVVRGVTFALDHMVNGGRAQALPDK